MSAFQAGSSAFSTPVVPAGWGREQRDSQGLTGQQQQQQLGLGQPQGGTLQRSQPGSSPQQQQQMDRQSSFTFGGSMPQPFRSFQQQQAQQAQQQQQQVTDPPTLQVQQQNGYNPANKNPYTFGPQLMSGAMQDLQGSSTDAQNVSRSSSFRMPRRSDGTAGGSSASPMQAFNLGVSDPQASFGQSQQQSKTVRWHDAPDQPSQGQSIYPNLSNNQTPNSSLPFRGAQQQPQSGQGLSSGFANPSMASQQPMQTPLRPQQASSGAFGAGSFGGGASASWTTPATQTQQKTETPRSAFNTSLSSMARPIPTLASVHRQPSAPAGSQTPAPQLTAASSIAGSIAAAAAASASKVSGNNNMTAPIAVDVTDATGAVVTTRPAIMGRIKWNAAGVVTCWFLPHFGPVSAFYWAVLDATYKLSNGAFDLHLAEFLSWLRTAAILLCIVNLFEAIIRLQTHSLPTSHTSSATGGAKASTATATSASSGPTPSQRKPSLHCPPSRAASLSSSPANKLSQNTMVNKRSMPRQYAQDSPLRDSILRASVSAQHDVSYRQSSPNLLETGRRLPSETPRLQSLRGSSASTRKASSGATPLAAYLARKQERMASGQDFADLSFEGGNSSVGDISSLSTDSIEIDRALRALSANYGRELSQTHSSAPPNVAA